MWEKNHVNKEIFMEQALWVNCLDGADPAALAGELNTRRRVCFNPDSF